MELTPELIQILAKTPFCRSAIAQLSDFLVDLSPESASSLVSELTARGEAKALNRLLNVCAYREFRLDPAALAESVCTIDDISHLPYCMKYQDADIVPHLLNSARSSLLSWQRQAVAARLATELAIRHEVALPETRQTLLHLREEIRDPITVMLVDETLDMLEVDMFKGDMFPIMINFDIQDDLPERPPPTVIGGGGTVRRPIAKLGRNDPCHCGSGKKYKRCCIAKDQELLADASAFAGVTQTQLHENPGIVDDPSVIHELRSFEVKNLKAENLSTQQLWAAYDRSLVFDLFDVALDMLAALSQRTDLAYPFDPGHFAEIMDKALSRGDLDIAKRARAHVPVDCDYIDWNYIDMQFDLYANPGLVTRLERYCAGALTAAEPSPDLHSMCDLAHTLRHAFPALSILFARAAVQQNSLDILDNEVLVEIVHDARIDLGLDPWGDPIDSLFEASEEYLGERLDDQKRAAEEKRLREELARTREQALQTSRALIEKEAALKTLTQKLETTTQARTRDVKPATATVSESADETKERRVFRRICG